MDGEIWLDSEGRKYRHELHEPEWLGLLGQGSVDYQWVLHIYHAEAGEQYRSLDVYVRVDNNHFEQLEWDGPGRKQAVVGTILRAAKEALFLGLLGPRTDVKLAHGTDNPLGLSIDFSSKPPVFRYDPDPQYQEKLREFIRTGILRKLAPERLSGVEYSALADALPVEEAMLGSQLDEMVVEGLVNRTQVDGQSPEVFKIRDSGIAYLMGLDGSVTTSPAASPSDNTTNVINIESVSHSTILQAGAGATQTVVFDMTQLPKLLETLSELKSRLAGERIDPAAKVEIGAEIETIEVQAKSSKPKATIIAVALKSLQSILESAAGSLGAEFLRRLVFPPGT